MLFLSWIYYIYCVGWSAVGVYNKQYALCTNDTSVRCAPTVRQQYLCKIMQIPWKFFHIKTKSMLYLYWFPTFRGPCHLNASIGKQTPVTFSSVSAYSSRLYLLSAFSVALLGHLHFLSPYLLSLPVTLLCILRLCHSVSSSKFSSASCCSLIHFKGANYIFSNFCVLWPIKISLFKILNIGISI